MRNNGILLLAFVVGLGLLVSCEKNGNQQKKEIVQKLRPVIDGEWWQIAGNPDLGAYTTDEQQPVDFGIWQATDGTWQLWSCIRKTKAGENTRVFHGWEGKSLISKDWKPMGITMEGDTTLGEASGGMQAPYVFKENGLYHMAYGDWNRICYASSKDGKKFTRVLNKNGQPNLFTSPYNNARDAMVYKENDLYYLYYMAHTDPDSTIVENGQKARKKYRSIIFCRTSADFVHWSEPMNVSSGGWAGDKSTWYGGDAECPFVLKKDGYYYLFRNQRYGEDGLNTQYASKNPLDFGVGHDDFMIGTLPITAPEIILYEGQYYIAALNPGLDGIRMAKLKWVKE
ncbi:hypothetical protein [Maribacter sp. 2304DJ31-5]|uniref:hypothetical protein n=1 Tax=Maribacter sp. 2304DJ31-5 TaxID=3386273 RepID=UPI0039BD81D3